MTSLDTLNNPHAADADAQLAALTSYVENITRGDNPEQEFQERWSFLRAEVENGNATPEQATQALYSVPSKRINAILQADLEYTEKILQQRGCDVDSMSDEDKEKLGLTLLGQQMQYTEESFELALIPNAGADNADSDGDPAAASSEAEPQTSRRQRASEALKAGLSGMKDRVSLTFKETRSAFRHMVETKRAVRGTDGNERATALENAERAERDFKLRVAKTTGALAISSFVAERVTSGDSSTAGSLIRGATIGLIGTSIAMGYEYTTKLRERASDASLSLSARATNTAGRVISAVSEKARNLSLPDRFKEQQMLSNSEIKAILPTLPQQDQDIIAAINTRILAIEGDDNFDREDTTSPLTKEYTQLVHRQENIYNTLDDYYGKEKIKRSVKIAAGVGVVALGAAALYINRYGFRMIDINMPDMPWENGGSKGGNKSGGGLVDQTPSGSGSRTGASETATTLPGNGSSRGSVTEHLTPKRQGIYDQLDSGSQEQLDQFMPTGSGQNSNPTNVMLDAADQISGTHNVQIGSEEFQKISENTFKLAAKKEEFLGNSTGVQRQQLGQRFDANFTAWLEHMKDLEEAANS